MSDTSKSKTGREDGRSEASTYTVDEYVSNHKRVGAQTWYRVVGPDGKTVRSGFTRRKYAESHAAALAARQGGRITTGADGLCRIPYCQSNQTKRGHTARQKAAMLKRKARGGFWCVGCHSGIVPRNQGSDYCTACLRRS